MTFTAFDRAYELKVEHSMLLDSKVQASVDMLIAPAGLVSSQILKGGKVD